jgi:hypothetical protein
VNGRVGSIDRGAVYRQDNDVDMQSSEEKAKP